MPAYLDYLIFIAIEVFNICVICVSFSCVSEFELLLKPKNSFCSTRKKCRNFKESVQVVNVNVSIPDDK